MESNETTLGAKSRIFARTEGIAIAKIVVGCVLYALSVVLFIDPVHIIPGSVTGIGVVVKTLTGFPIGLLSIIINVPLVIWATVVLGPRILVHTGLTVFLSSVLIDVLAFLQPFTTDMFLASVFGGVVMGVGLGLILDGGGTTGGTTVVGRLVLKRWPNIPMGDVLLVGDFIIITIGSILLRDWDLFLWSLVDLYVCVVVINFVMYNFKKQVEMVVETARREQVKEAIAGFRTTRIISQQPNRLYLVAKKSVVSKLQRAIEEVDSHAVGTTFEVDYNFGGGSLRSAYENQLDSVEALSDDLADESVLDS